MKKKLNKLVAGNKKNLLILSGGTLISQLFPFLLSPILTRLYSPDQFATLELVLRISSLFAVLSTLRFEIAIPLPKEEEKAMNIYVLSILSSLIMSLICLILFAVFQSQIGVLLNNTEIKDWILYIPILIFLSGVSQSGANALLRDAKYKYISLSKIVDSALNNLGKIFLGIMLSSSIFGLIFPNFIGLFALALITTLTIKRSWFFKLFNTSYSQLKSTFREFQEFPKVNLPTSIVDVLQISLVVIIVSHYFGSYALGLYALKLRILKTPTIIIGTSTGQIFYQTASRQHANGQSIKPLFIKYLTHFSLLGIVIFVPFVLAGPEIFSFVFGAKWELAGTLAQYTSPWMFFNFIASAFSLLPVILRQQKIVLYFSLFNLILVISCWIIGFYIFDSFLNTVGLLAVVESIYFIIVNFWYYKIVSEFDRHV